MDEILWGAEEMVDHPGVERARNAQGLDAVPPCCRQGRADEPSPQADERRREPAPDQCRIRIDKRLEAHREASG